MTESDVFYRALGAMYKELCGELSSLKTLDAVMKAPDGERISVTHNVCTVDTEWITMIERGLVFVGKAIEEDRQFIRSDGEVKPIEKVKHISKESVQHLSKHSDLITREQKQDIVPDKLYTVEKESDYAVYENKFLYLLLTRVREFVTVRYEAIVSAYKEYYGEYEVIKTVKTPTRTMQFSFKLSDKQDDAVFAPAEDDCAAAIARMDKILSSVNFYMRSPIMQEVAKADNKITGAITKTNVLLMNKNFSAALKLYEYLTAYEEDGYKVEKRVDEPQFDDVAKRELAIPPLLSAFIVYEHGLKIESYLQAEFEKEELRRAEEAQKELLKKLKALKKRIERSGESMEEYALMLEERNAIIENSYSLYQDALKDIDELEGKISRMQSEIEVLEEEIQKLNAEIDGLREDMRRAEEEHKKQLEETIKRFEEEIAGLKEAHENEIAALKEEYEKQIAAINAAAEEKIASLKSAHAEELAATKQKAQEQYDALKRRLEEQMARMSEAHKAEVDKLKAEHKKKIDSLNAEYARQRETLRADCEKRVDAYMKKANESADKARQAASDAALAERTLRLTLEERDVLRAKLTAIRKEQGLLTAADDFTTEEGFNELEHEFEVLGRLLNDEWKGVKAMLRKEILGAKRQSGRKKSKGSKEYIELKEFVEQENAQGSEINGRADEEGISDKADGPQTAESEDDIIDSSQSDERASDINDNAQSVASSGEFLGESSDLDEANFDIADEGEEHYGDDTDEGADKRSGEEE